MKQTRRPLVLIADNDPQLLSQVGGHLERWEYRTASAQNRAQLLHQLTAVSPDLLIVDVSLAGHHDLEFLSQLFEQGFQLPVLFLASRAGVETAATPIERGTIDVLQKPLNPARLQTAIGRALEKPVNQAASRFGVNGTAQVSQPEILGQSTAIQHVKSLIDAVARTNATVLILGENGTGKELVAHEIHRCSRRSEGPFVPVDLGALPPSLLESALFGHEKGSFTGAHRSNKGCFELAQAGTVFLDEIGELSLELQPKLMRFLQAQTVQPIGSNDAKKVDVRIVAATNRDVDQMLDRGELREDLFYRLNVLRITVPPLRERREDIPLLVRTFAVRAAEKNFKEVTSFTPEAVDVFCGYEWPGNVRQLENITERLVILCRDREIGINMLPPELMANRRPTSNGYQPHHGLGNGLTPFEKTERDMILAALSHTGGHVVQAARELGVGQATIYRKIKKYGISRD